MPKRHSTLTIRGLRAALSLAAMLVAPLAQAEDADVLAGYDAYTQATRSGDYANAVAPVEAALQRAERLYDDGNETVALLSYHYGRALFRAGDRQASYEALEVAKSRYAQAFGDQTVDMVAVLLGLGDAAETTGIARQQYEAAIKVSETANGTDSAAHARVLIHAGRGLVETHRTDTDAGMLVTARKLLASQDTAPASLKAEAAMELGKLRLMQGRLDTAVELSLEAVALDDSARTAPAHTMLVKIYESREQRDAATPHALAIGRLSNARDAAEDYLPLHRVAPRYPTNALTAGKTGYVDFQFTVDEAGFTRDIEVVGGEEVSTFRGEATEAVRLFRYAPRFVDGAAVATPGVRTRIRFEIQR